MLCVAFLVVMLSVVMMSVVMVSSYAEYRYAGKLSVATRLADISLFPFTNYN
jgi:hypothetical protein